MRSFFWRIVAASSLSSVEYNTSKCSMASYVGLPLALVIFRFIFGRLKAEYGSELTSPLPPSSLFRANSSLSPKSRSHLCTKHSNGAPNSNLSNSVVIPGYPSNTLPRLSFTNSLCTTTECKSSVLPTRELKKSTSFLLAHPLPRIMCRRVAIKENSPGSSESLYLATTACCAEPSPSAGATALFGTCVVHCGTG